MEASLTYAASTRPVAAELSQSGYIRAICFFTLIAAGVVTLGAVMSYGWTFSWLLLGVCFVGAVVGIIMFQASRTAIVSFAGVSMLSFFLGLMMGPAVHHYTGVTVAEALVLTAMCMIVMSSLGIVFPQVFRGWGPYLFAALTLLVVAQFAQMIFVYLGFPAAANMPVLVWAGIALFLAYTAYDWTVAIDMDPTWDNAIDASGSLILDAVNLFIRILQILGNSDD